MEKRCYIAGKISDLPKDEYMSNFRLGKAEVEEMGLTPVCPVDLPHEHDKSWASYMREDLRAMLTCQHIYALNNWKQSHGARIEVELALSLGIKLIEQP